MICERNHVSNFFDPKCFLESRCDYTDVSTEIEKRLHNFGVCILGVGIYCVSGIKMPDGSSLFGMGNATKIILAQNIESGYAIKLGSFCTVKNLSVMGANEPTEHPTNVEKRHGILFEGNASVTKNYANQPRNSIIESCFISSFNGGGITCLDTGYSVASSITASNCHILKCGACINIPYFSEYHEFTNILCSDSLYGCINNGGNNVFINCGFNSNVTAFLIDNSHGRSNNQAHGSAIGCTFNHSDGNKGVGIAVLGAKWGYVFSGCQIFYSKIILENSTNIVFNAINAGKAIDIKIKGGNMTAFSNCVFLERPNISVEDNDRVKFTNCFTREGEEINI